MSSRDAILGRIRGLLKDEPSPPLPPAPEVWPRLNPTRDEMAQRFARELAEVSGETIRCGSAADARAKLAELVREAAGSSEGTAPTVAPLAAMDRPLCRELAEGLALPAGQVLWSTADWSPQTLADVPAALIEADVLLADTGSSMVACPTAPDRWLCYLPPTCIVVASADRLVEHLPAAWDKIAPRAADPQTRGEFVFITGPSRTADIEKILILGVHGPKRLVVLIVG